jgi:aldo/keto reductase family protein
LGSARVACRERPWNPPKQATRFHKGSNRPPYSRCSEALLRNRTPLRCRRPERPRELAAASPTPLLPDRLAVRGRVAAARPRSDDRVGRAQARRDAAQIALAWLLHRDEHILLIPGTSSAAHLEQNVAAAGIALDGDDLAALDRVPVR